MAKSFHSTVILWLQFFWSSLACLEILERSSSTERGIREVLISKQSTDLDGVCTRDGLAIKLVDLVIIGAADGCRDCRIFCRFCRSKIGWESKRNMLSITYYSIRADLFVQRTSGFFSSISSAFFVKYTTSMPLRMTRAQSKPLKGASQYKRKLLS